MRFLHSQSQSARLAAERRFANELVVGLKMDGAVEVGKAPELGGSVPDLLAQAHHRRATSEWSVAVLPFLHRIAAVGKMT